MISILVINPSINSKKMRNHIKYRNVEDIDKAIMRLERRQTTSSMDLSDEKNLIKEVRSTHSSFTCLYRSM